MLDLGALTRPFGHEFNVQYGLASRDNRISDFFSFFGTRNNYQYGAFGTTAFDQGASVLGSVPYSPSYQDENDFVNNFALHFGKNNAQTFQVLNVEHTADFYNNYGATQYLFDNQDPGELLQVQQYIHRRPWG